MKVIGVWLDVRRMIWADAGELEPALSDRVVVRLPEGELSGRVHVAAAQWLAPPGAVDGIVTTVERQTVARVEEDIPGADMPPLGTRARVGGVEGLVTAIDPVHRLVTVTPETGEPVTALVTDLL